MGASRVVARYGDPVAFGLASRLHLIRRRVIVAGCRFAVR